jgi:hypothetical protein
MERPPAGTGARCDTRREAGAAPAPQERFLDPMIESLKKLIEQSTEALGADSTSTLMLKQQLAALEAKQGQAPKVFWLQPAPPESKSDSNS